MAKEVEPVACSMTAMIQTFIQIIRLFYDGVLSFPTPNWSILPKTMSLLRHLSCWTSMQELNSLGKTHF